MNEKLRLTLHPWPPRDIEQLRRAFDDSHSKRWVDELMRALMARFPVVGEDALASALISVWGLCLRCDTHELASRFPCSSDLGAYIWKSALREASRLCGDLPLGSAHLSVREDSHMLQNEAFPPSSWAEVEGTQWGGPYGSVASTLGGLSLEERDILLTVMTCSDRRKAAAKLGISRRTLFRRLESMRTRIEQRYS